MVMLTSVSLPLSPCPALFSGKSKRKQKKDLNTNTNNNNVDSFSKSSDAFKLDSQQPIFHNLSNATSSFLQEHPKIKENETLAIFCDAMTEHILENFKKHDISMDFNVFKVDLQGKPLVVVTSAENCDYIQAELNKAKNKDLLYEINMPQDALVINPTTGKVLCTNDQNHKTMKQVLKNLKLNPFS